MLDSIHEPLCNIFSICTETDKSAFWGVATGLISSIIIAIALLARKLIWKFIAAIARYIYLVVTTLYGLLCGKLAISENQKTNHHDKFPAVEHLNWHPQFSKVVKSVQDRTSVIVLGPSGSGRTEIAIAALKHIGYPENSDPAKCSFILIDCTSKQSSESVLDSILEANSVSVSTQEGVDRKVERISIISQAFFCSMVLSNIDYLPAPDQKIVLSLPGRTSTKFKFVFTSQPSVRLYSPDISRISLQALEGRHIEAICKSSDSPSIRALSAHDIDRIILETKGAFVPITAAIRNSDSSSALFELISDVGDEVGIVRTAILKPVSLMEDNRRRAIVFVARYGGKASWKLLRHVFALEDHDVRAIKQQLALTPSVFFRDDVASGTIELSAYAMENITKEYLRKYNYARSSTIASIVSFFSSFDEIQGLHLRYQEFSADRYILRPIIDDIAQTVEVNTLFNFYKSFCELLYNRGYFEQRIELGLEIARLLEKKGSLSLASWVLCSAGSVATVLGQTEVARTHINRAKQLALQSESTNDVLRAERALASTFYRDGRSKFFEAQRSVDYVLQHPEVQADLTNLVDAVYLKVCIQLRQLQLPISEADKSEITDLINHMKSACEKAGWKRGYAYASLEEARLSAALGDLGSAQQIASEALSIGEDYEDKRHVARCQMFIGQLALANSRKLIGKGFSAGINRVREAALEFSRLKMDNEFEEASALAAAGLGVRAGQRLPFQIWLSSYSIGGD